MAGPCRRRCSSRWRSGPAARGRRHRAGAVLDVLAREGLGRAAVDVQSQPQARRVGRALHDEAGDVGRHACGPVDEEQVRVAFHQQHRLAEAGRPLGDLGLDRRERALVAHVGLQADRHGGGAVALGGVEGRVDPRERRRAARRVLLHAQRPLLGGLGLALAVDHAVAVPRRLIVVGADDVHGPRTSRPTATSGRSRGTRRTGRRRSPRPRRGCARAPGRRRAGSRPGAPSGDRRRCWLGGSPSTRCRRGCR